MTNRTDDFSPLKTFSRDYWLNLKHVDPVKAEEYRRKMTNSGVKEEPESAIDIKILRKGLFSKGVNNANFLTKEQVLEKSKELGILS